MLGQHRYPQSTTEVGEQGLVERDLEGVVIEHLDVLDHVEDRAGTLGLDPLVEDEVLDRPAHVLRGQRRPVTEAGIGAEMDPEPQAVGVELPGVGEHPLQLEGIGVVAGHRFQDLVEHAPAVHIPREVGGDSRELGAEDLGELPVRRIAGDITRVAGRDDRSLPVDRHPRTSP